MTRKYTVEIEDADESGDEFIVLTRKNFYKVEKLVDFFKANPEMLDKLIRDVGKGIQE